MVEFPFEFDGVLLEQDDGGLWVTRLGSNAYWIGPRTLRAIKESGLLNDRDT